VGAPTAQCRLCAAPLERVVADLGMIPLVNELLESQSASLAQERFPLRVRVCDSCLLVQIDETVPPARLFQDYLYLSSFSDAWLRHAGRFVDWAVDHLGLGADSLVLEVASNDGYLLRQMAERGVPVLGVEPAANVAAVAEAAGVPTRTEFFDSTFAEKLVAEGTRADLVVANNVFAHVPDPADFVRGLATVLQPDGLLSIEVPHVLRLLRDSEFDTIYHEHYSYFSVLVLTPLLGAAGLEIVDVVELPTHGGSIRVLARHAGAARREDGAGLHKVVTDEAAAALDDPASYEVLAPHVTTAVTSLRRFVEGAVQRGETIAAYGAAAKGAVLLNAAGIGVDAIPLVADRSPYKIGRFLPGVGIPIVSVDDLLAARPDHVLVLAWNFLDEIVEQLSVVRTWGGDFVTPLPEVRVHP
jgi:SAM-dependent methyltransferase